MPSKLRLLALSGIGMLTTACPNANTYGTPRTTAAGRVSVTLAAEVYQLRRQVSDGLSETGESLTRTSGRTYLVAPTCQLRVGLSDRVDMGFRVANSSSLGGDLKWNFLRAPALDLAVAPSMQSISIEVNGGDEYVQHWHLPVLVGVNINEAMSVILTPGVSYAALRGEARPSFISTIDVPGETSGVMGRLGLGLDLRPTKGFALHPEMTALHAVDDDVTFIMFGLGFNFVNLPDFSDAGL